MSTISAVNTDISTGKRIRARKDADKQEAVIKMGTLKESVEELIKLYRYSKVASDTFSEAVKNIAEKAGLQASVVRKFIAARAGEKFEDKKRDAEQLSLCFDEIGG